MKSDAPVGVPGDVPRGDGAGASSRVVTGFQGKPRSIPSAYYYEGGTSVRVYFSGAGTFNVSLGADSSAAFEIWTDVRGIEALIGAAQAVLVRARIALEEAGGELVAAPPPGPFVLDPTDVPF
jgi:hypothetical protein